MILNELCIKNAAFIQDGLYRIFHDLTRCLLDSGVYLWGYVIYFNVAVYEFLLIPDMERFLGPGI